MFTLQQIKAAHSKVRSGADFPAYIRELRNIGVISYETFVTDGHTRYSGTGDYTTSSPAMYTPLDISKNTDAREFKAALLSHQQGNTDYSTFCNDCAKSGIVKWVVSINQMTCTYYDSEGNEMLVEKIPG